jgi:hypothetical protein
MTHFFRTAVALAVSFISYSLFAAQPAAAEPQIAFASTVVTVSGVTPGASVLVFGYGLEARTYESFPLRWSATVEDEDRDGIVTFDAQHAIPLRSVWVAADMTNADFAVATPPGFSVMRSDLSSSSLRRNGKDVSAVDFERTPITMIYVLPGRRGAWITREEDGSPTDVDGRANGHTVADVRRGKPLRGTDAVSSFEPGGTLIVFDELHFEIRAMRLTPSLLGGAH